MKCEELVMKMVWDAEEELSIMARILQVFTTTETDKGRKEK